MVPLVEAFKRASSPGVFYALSKNVNIIRLDMTSDLLWLQIAKKKKITEKQQKPNSKADFIIKDCGLKILFDQSIYKKNSASAAISILQKICE